MESHEKLIKHDEGFSIRGSDELGWGFVEGKNPRTEQVLTKREYRAINTCAKRRHIRGIGHL